MSRTLLLASAIIRTYRSNPSTRPRLATAATTTVPSAGPPTLKLVDVTTASVPDVPPRTKPTMDAGRCTWNTTLQAIEVESSRYVPLIAAVTVATRVLPPDRARASHASAPTAPPRSRTAWSLDLDKDEERVTTGVHALAT